MAAQLTGTAADKQQIRGYAQQYLKRWKRPAVLPITRFNEGMEDSSFSQCFGPEKKPGLIEMLFGCSPI